MTDEPEKMSPVARLIPLAGARQIGSFHVSELPDDIVDQLRTDAVAKDTAPRLVHRALDEG